MKKIGKKLSFLTKIMLVAGLLISNLSSLSVVFAYEVAEDVIITLNEDVLEISYTEELAEEVEAVNVKVYENYTYLDGTSETFDESSKKEIVSVYSLTAEQLLLAAEGKLELTHDSIFAIEEDTISNYKLFDGTYSARVEIVDVTDYSEEVLDENEVLSNDETIAEVQTTETESTATEAELEEVPTLGTESATLEEVNGEVIAEATYEKEMLHESGLDIKLYDITNNVEISLVDGKYPVSLDNSKVEVVAQILSGGLNPTDVFVYNDEEYIASELILKGFSNEFDFNGYLFGEYELPVEVKLQKVLPIIGEETPEESYEEVVYSDSVSIAYESYEMNSAVLNMFAVQGGYGDSYFFNSQDADGTLYVLSDFETTTESTEETVVTKTMLDLYNMLNVELGVEEDVEPIITYSLLKNGINVLESYVPANEEDTLESYLSTITLDETVQIVLSNEGLTVTYDVVLAGDLDNNNVITEDDVLELINQVVGESEIANVEKSDLYGFDGEVNSLDVLVLNQAVKNQVWEAKLVETEVTLDASLVVNTDTEESLISGDEFTVDYVLSLTDYEVNGIAGVFNYDETLFELVSVEVANEWVGNDYEGNFLYLGAESLTGPELEDSETELPETEDTEVILSEENVLEEEITSVDYVVLTATFKALKSTDEESNNVITLEEIELFNSTTESATYYVLDQNSISTEAIEVVASEDNTLQYLEIAGVEITLEDGVYEYEITVPSDVTAVDLKYILGNVAASVTSAVYPEELAEGSNTIVVTVTSETGVSQDYTITVIREEVKEETTTQINYNNNYDNYENTEEDVVVTPGTTEEEDDEKEEEESNLSRIIIIILILVVIAGLVYLIFKDEDDEETKKANKAVNKLKKETLEPEVKEVKKVNKTSSTKTSTKSTNKTGSNKNKSSKSNSKNKKKES